MLRFLHHAVQRFGTWMNARKHVKPLPALSSLPREQIPPLDVLMIWHAYMLSPIAYNEDAQGNIPALGKLGGMPWDQLVRCPISLIEFVDNSYLSFRPLASMLRHSILRQLKHSLLTGNTRPSSPSILRSVRNLLRNLAKNPNSALISLKRYVGDPEMCQ